MLRTKLPLALQRLHTDGSFPAGSDAPTLPPTGLVERMTQNPPDVADLLHMEEKVLDTPAEVDEILQRTPSELQHNRALENSIVFQEQLDKLIASATKRFNDTLELFEHYREGLGQRLRQAAEEVLWADNSEREGQTKGPSIVPSDEVDGVTDEINHDSEAVWQTRL